MTDYRRMPKSPCNNQQNLTDGLAFVADLANSDTLAQASTLVVEVLVDVELRLALVVVLDTLDVGERA